ncbi:MAG: transcriptional regulator [Gemmatimonadota bacterium]|nr:transcriptional regulator [Gemmatimonadota bacterium]
MILVSSPLSERLRRLRGGTEGFFRSRDIEAVGLRFRDLRELVDARAIERVARGLYRIADTEAAQHYTLAAVCARIPKAIVCLLSALTVHEIGTQLPREVWIAIAHKARAPRIPELPIRIIRFTGSSLTYGVEPVHLDGVASRITNVARTVVDCFRFRRLVGRDVAQEALREAIREQKTSIDEVWRTAEVCRAKSLVMPYLEMLAG